MPYQIRKLLPQERSSVEKLRDEYSSDYLLYWDNEFIVAEGEEGIAGAMSYYFDGRYHQIQNLLLKKNSPKRLVVRMYDYVEKAILDKGFDKLVSYVENTNNPLQTYLQRVGFKAYDNNKNGVWFYKTLKKEN